MLVFSALFVTIRAWVAHAFPERVPPRVGADFSVFWTASYLMLHGSPAQAYDFSALSRLSATLFDTLRHGAFAPWLYPPTYLLLVTPLALLPFALAYPLFVALGVGVLGCAAWRVAGLGAVAGASCGRTRAGRRAVRVRHRDARAERLPHRVVRGARRLLGRAPAIVGRPVHRAAVGEAADGAAVPVRADCRPRVAHPRVGRARQRRVRRAQRAGVRHGIAAPVRRERGARALDRARARRGVLARVVDAVRGAAARRRAVERGLCGPRRCRRDRRRVRRLGRHARRPRARGGAGSRAKACGTSAAAMEYSAANADTSQFDRRRARTSCIASDASTSVAAACTR